MPNQFWTRLQSRVRRWWDGERIPYENDPHSGVAIFAERHQRHWTARFVNWLWDYWRAYHRWIIGVVIAVLLATWAA